ncbi:hypothetical protein MMC28_003301 [Mycoblastus sanguinarius]|nr:hypothetical protein [Mycoblastus sanguinarius]
MVPLAEYSVRILAFGASITAGWMSGGRYFNPYANELATQLGTAFPASNFTIVIDGYPGDCAINGQYLERMQKNTETAAVPYDWVIVQGGGNDLGHGREPEAIFEQLKKVWRIALEANSQVLALTVTKTDPCSERQTERMAALNKLLTEHEETGFYTLDVHTVISGRDLDPDGTHLSKEGQEKVGHFIATWMADMIPKTQN